MVYIPMTEEDPSDVWETRITTPRLEHKEDTEEFQYDRLEQVSAGIEGWLGATPLYPTHESLVKAAMAKAAQELEDNKETLTTERLLEVSKNWEKRLYREEKRDREDWHAKAMGATAAYHYIEGEDVTGTAEQEKAWADPSKTWYWNDDQSKRRVLREEAQRFVDPETYAKLANTVINTSVAKLIKDPNIPERIRRRLEHLTTQPFRGPPKKEVVAETTLQWLGKTAVTLLGAPSRYPLSYNADLLKQRLDSGWGKEIEARGTGPTPEEITYIDSMGKPVWKGLTQADMAALPPKWIMGKGKYGGGRTGVLHYPDKRLNPEYEKELKKRMGGEFTPSQEVSLYGYKDVYGHDIEKTTLGLTGEQAAKVGYDRDIPRALGAAYEGFWNDPSAPQLAEQLHRFKTHVSGAAVRELESMPLDDPRRNRYFGKDDEERKRLSIQMAMKRFGKPVTAPEYDFQVKKYLSQLSATTGRFHKFGMREPEVMVEEATREQKQKAIAHAEDYFKGRVNREQLLKKAEEIYKEYPVIKMSSDMLRLDTFEDAMNNPELTELLHQVILDPLWVVGPVKAVRGGMMIARGAATGYGMAKAGKFGKNVSKFATGAGEFGTAAKRFAPEAAAGTRQRVVSRAERLAVAGDEARVAATDAVNEVQRVQDKVLRQSAKQADPMGFVNPSQELEAARVKAVAAGKALIKARAKQARAARIAKVPEVFDEVKKASENGYQKLSEAFRHFTKTDRDYTSLGDLKDDVGMMSRAAEDAGHGSSGVLRSLGDDLLNELNLAKTEQEQDILHQLLSGEFRAAFEGAGATIRPSEAMKELLKNPKMPAAQQLEILTAEAVRTYHLPKHLAEVPGRVRAMSDKFYEAAVAAGQMSKVENGIIGVAKHVLNYVPRWLKDTEKIHDDVMSLGLKFADGKEVEHLGDAAALINPKYHHRSSELEGALRKVVGPGEELSMKNFVKKTEEFMDDRGINTVEEAWTKLGVSKSEARLINEVKASREAIAEVARAQQINPEQYFREIAAVRRAMDNTDYLGVMSDLATPYRVLKRVTGKAAIERKPLGDLYYWQKNPLKQYEAYIKDISTRAGVTGEIKELGRAFGVDHVAGVLSDSSMIKISAQGFKGNSKKAAEVAEILSTHHGIQMVPLSPTMSQDVAKVLLPAGRKLGEDAVTFVPKVVANRLQNLLMITPAARQTNLYKGLDHFRQAWVRPANAWFRQAATVLRSGSFQAVNYHGAVGLGYLGLGIDAANPALQVGAHRVAFSAAFGGSELAKGARMMLPRSPSGEMLKLGDALEIMTEYGILNQGMMKYGLDISAGRGLLSVPANMLSRTARKFKLQQTAEFSDNYQKAVLFMGHLRSTSRKDIYRTLDFVAEYGQNYNRMTPFEKSAMRDMFTFYTWSRFILPHLATQMYKNPNRLQAFERIKSVIEYNNRYERPETGIGTPAWAWMQGAVTAPKLYQPKPGEGGPHEYTVSILETPLASTSTLAGGFMGETALHAQLGPVPRAFMAAITGGDYGSGHVWEQPLRMPGLDDFDSPSAAMEYLYDFNDSKAGRWAVNMVPFGGAFLNIIKLYQKEGMYSEAAEMFMRHKAKRDFQGLDWLIAPMFGMKPLSTPPFIEIGGFKVPTLGLTREYTVRPAATTYRRSKEFEGAGQLLQIPSRKPKATEQTLTIGED